ncbi:MAG: hypothetical protein QOC94_3258 [Actinoplanes sp.]|jgi:hypothetical protein|nr:hypothetical protein [Actinoplanes sp.]MDT5033087.1 hypothetical protein [Actinoplanes sp.]
MAEANDRDAERQELPRRVAGSHLPAAAYRAVGIAKVPDSRWSCSEPALRILLNGLRRWPVIER